MPDEKNGVENGKPFHSLTEYYTRYLEKKPADQVKRQHKVMKLLDKLESHGAVLRKLADEPDDAKLKAAMRKLDDDGVVMAIEKIRKNCEVGVVKAKAKAIYKFWKRLVFPPSLPTQSQAEH